jgi:hypothetical protein
VATVYGGSFTGRGGGEARGILTSHVGTTLEADAVTALGEDGGSNYGLNISNGTATVRGGAFTGRAGTDAWGIYNSAYLLAAGVTALGEDGTNNHGLGSGGYTADVARSVLEGATYSVVHSSGTITISNSRLVGGPVGGTPTCVLVSRGTAVSSDAGICP